MECIRPTSASRGDIMAEGYYEVKDDLTNVLYWTGLEEDTVDILRSEAPHTGFEPIATEVDGSLGYYEDKFDFPNENRIVYYQVGPIFLHIGAIPGPIAKEIIRRDRWFLQSRYSGATTATLYIRKTLAQPCSACWDDIQKKITKSNCSVCYGTGLRDPYYPGIDIQVSNSMPSLLRQPQADHIDQSYNSQIWTTNMPRMKPGDLLKRNAYLWRVEAVQTTRQEKVVVKQMVSLRRLETSRSEYKLPFYRE